MQFKNIYTQTLTGYLLGLLALFSSHIFLLLRYPNDFLELSSSETLLSLIMALRVDTITLLTLTGIVILVLLFPIKVITNRKFRAFIGTLWGMNLISITLFSYSNVLYFDFSHRHLSNEFLSLANDTHIIMDMALHSFLPYTIGALITFFVWIYLYFKIFSAPLKSEKITNLNIFFYLLLIVIIVFGIRSKLTGKSFGMSDAFVTNKVSSGTLALNGAFTVYRTVSADPHMHKLLSYDEALPIVQHLLASKKTSFVDKKFPLMRAYQSQEREKHNVVIVLLESWGAEHIDGFTKYPELNVTPYFKKMASESLKFTNFYANGYRSIYGITSIFTGITLPKGFEFLGNGLELSRLSYLGTIAKKNGYSTVAMQGSPRRSYRVDAVSNLAGFDTYYGAEDMPNVEDVEGDRAPVLGTYDYNLLNFYHKKLNTMKEPFMGFAFTATNHNDYYLPHSKFERYPHDLKNYYGQLNAFIYVDNAIERFMESVKKEPWFENTIFIFTADHGTHDPLNPIGQKLRGGNITPLPSIEHFRIPLIIYAPKIFKPKEVSTLGSQADFLPTIIDILGFENSFTTMSNSLFDVSIENRFVYYYGGTTIGLIKDEGYLQYNFKKVVGASGTPQQQEQMRKELFAIDMMEATLIETNRWTE